MAQLRCIGIRPVRMRDPVFAANRVLFHGIALISQGQKLLTIVPQHAQFIRLQTF
ncbi:hypothetical protein D3C75_1125350 [compost metagenome]